MTSIHIHEQQCIFPKNCDCRPTGSDRDGTGKLTLEVCKQVPFHFIASTFKRGLRQTQCQQSHQEPLLCSRSELARVYPFG